MSFINSYLAFLYKICMKDSQGRLWLSGSYSFYIPHCELIFNQATHKKPEKVSILLKFGFDKEDALIRLFSLSRSSGDE